MNFHIFVGNELHPQQDLPLDQSLCPPKLWISAICFATFDGLAGDDQAVIRLLIRRQQTKKASSRYSRPSRAGLFQKKESLFVIVESETRSPREGVSSVSGKELLIGNGITVTTFQPQENAGKAPLSFFAYGQKCGRTGRN